MTLAGRLAWALVIVVLAVGGIVLAQLNGDRGAAENELERARAREMRLQGEADRLSEEIEDLASKETAERIVQDFCVEGLLRQTRNWNELLDDLPTVIYSSSEVDPYAARARDLVNEARRVSSRCSDAI